MHLHTLHIPKATTGPGIDKDCENVITACKECQDELPSLPKEPMLSHAQPERPFQHLAVDFATCQGKNYLIMIDCYSDWPSIQLMRRDTTARSLISALRNYFSRTAVPDLLYSDGGPQFRSHELANFLLDWEVTHVTSSPGYPASNGKAEAAVKAMKQIIRRCTRQSTTDEDLLARSLLQYRNTPSRKDGLSPAQKLYGHPVQDTLSVHYRAFNRKWQLKTDGSEVRKSQTLEKTTAHFNQNAVPLPEITVGTQVAVQNRETKLFDIYGVVIDVDQFRKCSVKIANGRILIRNRKFIRKRVPNSLFSQSDKNQSSENNPIAYLRPDRNVNRLKKR